MLRRQSNAGFNLVELMVVVSIIGILSSVAVPRFNSFRARAQQTEAKGGLSGVFLAAQAYMANANTFVETAAADATGAGIGFVLDGARPQYKYRIHSTQTAWAATATSVAAGTATAQALANGTVDIWRINANKWLCPVHDAVSNITAPTPTTTTKIGTGPNDCPQTGDGKGAALFDPDIQSTPDSVVN